MQYPPLFFGAGWGGGRREGGKEGEPGNEATLDRELHNTNTRYSSAMFEFNLNLAKRVSSAVSAKSVFFHA